jgi:hypothetical protein
VQSPDAGGEGRADGAGEEHVEGGEVRGRVLAVCGGWEEVVWGKAGGLEGAVVGGEAAEGFRVLYRQEMSASLLSINANVS